MPSETPVIVLKELAGNPPPQLNVVQQNMYPYTELIVTFWISVWILTAFAVLGIFIKAYRNK